MSFTRAIVRPPGPNFHQGQTTYQGTPADYQNALVQHKEYCGLLERCGLSLTQLKPDIRYPDSTFVEDTAVLFSEHAILCRPGAPTRLNEVAEMRRILGQFFSLLDSIQAPGLLDGGDVCQAGGHFFIGVSQRTNEEGARQMAHLVMQYGYTSSIIDIREIDGILHLKSGLAYIEDKRLVAINSLIDRMEFTGYQVIPVANGAEYAANCVRINEFVLVADGFPKLEDSLVASGYQTLAVDMSEFQKMDGGLSCLSLRF